MDKKLLNEAYYNGIRDGIKQYAWWRDGVQYVGTTGNTLKDALKDIDEKEKRALELIKQHFGVEE